MNKKKVQESIDAFVKATSHKTEEEQIEFYTHQIQLSFTVKVGTWMKEKKITRKYLAKKLGISRSNLKAFFSSEVYLTTNMMARIHHAIQMPIE